MKESTNLWLSSAARLPGVLACGVRYPDNSTFTQSWAEGFAPERLDNALRCVADTFQVLNLNRVPATSVRWVYEQAFLYCARRSDGICLGIFCTKDLQQKSPGAIERLLADFQSLRPAKA